MAQVYLLHSQESSSQRSVLGEGAKTPTGHAEHMIIRAQSAENGLSPGPSEGNLLVGVGKSMKELETSSKPLVE